MKKKPVLKKAPAAPASELPAVHALLESILTRGETSLRTLARKSGLDAGQISRFRKSGGGLSPAKVEALQKVLARYDDTQRVTVPDEHIRALALALCRRELSVFVGAGLSYLATHRTDKTRRLPLWKNLAPRLAEKLGQEIPAGLEPLRALDRLAGATDENQVRRVIGDVFDERDFQPSEAHAILARLPWLHVVTTNYDRLLANVIKPRHRFPIVLEEDYQRRCTVPESLVDGTVLNLVHLHGDLQHPHTLFRSDYRRWDERHPQAHQFLKEVIFAPRTVLFIGYGLGDPHVEDLIETVKSLTAAQHRVHAWMWNLTEDERKRLAQQGVRASAINHEDGWAAALQALEARHKEMSRGECADVAAPLEATREAKSNYAVTIRAQMERVNLTQYYIGEAQTADAITLPDLFVPPDLVPAEPAAGSAPRGKRGQGSLKTAPSAMIDMAGALMEAGDTRERCASLDSWLEKHPRLVLLGEPGQGKSTLLRHTAATQLAEWAGAVGKPPRFPVFIQLSHWERDCPPGTSLREYALGLMEESYGLPRATYEDWLKGGVLWLLDGIDEVRAEDRRRALYTALNDLPAAGDAIVVTSRPAGYFREENHEERLPAPWVELHLAPLSESQSLAMLTRIFGIFQRLEGLSVSPDAVFRQLGRETSLARLRRNALQLTMIAVFFRSRRELPRDRWVFYTFAAEYLMRSRNNMRSEPGPGVKPAAAGPSVDLSPGDVHGFFRSLAAGMMQQGTVTLHKSELLTTAHAHFTSQGKTGAARDAAMENILKAAQGLNGVLVERGRDLFGFVHLTYQEFYAAWWLHVNQEQAEKLAATHGPRDEWAVVWDLYVLSLEDNRLRLRQLHEALPQPEHRLRRLRRLRWLGLGAAPFAEVCPDGALLQWAETSLKDLKSNGGVEVLRVLANWERTYPDAIREALAGLLSEGKIESRQTAAQALGEQAAGRELLTELEILLKGTDDTARGFAEFSLALAARAGEPVVIDELKKLYASPALTMPARAAAARALGGAVPAVTLWPAPVREHRTLQLAEGVEMTFLKVTEGESPFWLQQTQVTQAQWLALMGGENPAHFKGPHLPVESVDWQQSQDFCAALGRHVEFREKFGADWQPGLPLEKHWELACRAGGKEEFNTGPGGDGASLGSHQANFNGHHPEGKAAPGVYRERTVVAGSFHPNDWGFHDLHGNVWEWCEDWYEKGRFRVIRGGCWYYHGTHCRAGYRFRAGPGIRSQDLGFRMSLRSMRT